MKNLPYVLLALAMLALAACSGASAVFSAGSSAGMWLTKPGDPPPADMEHQIAEHESWCYETLGYPECYAHPQDTSPNRLINVDPPNRYPLTPGEYDEMVFLDD